MTMPRSSRPGGAPPWAIAGPAGILLGIAIAAALDCATGAGGVALMLGLAR